MDSDPKSVPPLQFETAIPRAGQSDAASSPSGVTCAGCQRAIAHEYFDVNGQSVCESCRDQVTRQAETPRGWRLFLRAALFGLVAAILGAILYYAVIAITNFEIGIVAIAIGYMVGYGVRMATKGRGGRRFQVLALVLTYWAVGLAYTPLAFKGMQEDARQEDAQTKAKATPSQGLEFSETTAQINIPAAAAFLSGFALVLPVLVVFGSMPGGLISALIIGIGMRQAWSMTGVPQLTITGPYRIGAGPPA